MMQLTEREKTQLIFSLNLFSKCVHNNALKKGFWRHKTEEINLIHAVSQVYDEVCEFRDAVFDKNRMDKHLTNNTNLSVEIADIIMVLLDIGCHLKLQIPKIMIEKYLFNLSRPYLHGEGSKNDNT